MVSMRVVPKRLGNPVLIAGLVAGSLLGCEGPALEPESEVESVQNAVVTTGYVVDNGQLTVRVKTCNWADPREVNFAHCSVDFDFVLIGGGAEIEGNQPGA